jgi:tetratricopeptide (TPR) repeat protein
MRSKSSRTAPAILLAGACAAGLALWEADARVRRAETGDGDPEVRLAVLQRAAADPGSGAAEWLGYARALQSAGRHEHAAQAWRRAMALDPFAAEAQEGLAVALAEAGDSDGLFGHLGELVLSDARLALQSLARPAVVRHASDPRYAGLLAEARSQAVD